MSTNPTHPGANPAVTGGVVATLLVAGATKAAAFYVRAFGAKIVVACPEDDQGRTMHVHLSLNGSALMLGDAYPEHGYPLVEPRAFDLTLPVDGIHAWWARAVEAGCEPVMPVRDKVWGDLCGRLRDPFGVVRAMNQAKR